MEFLAQALPILVWFLLAILLVVFIIVGLKLIEMINATNVILDDLENKSKSLDGLFDAVDSIGDKLNSVTDRVVDGAMGLVTNLFNRRKSRRMEEDEDE